MTRSVRPSCPPIEMTLDELLAIVEHMKALGAEEREYQVLRALVETYDYLTEVVRDDGTTIRRLRQLLFGSQSERTKDVVGRAATGAADGTGPSGEAASAPPPPSGSTPAAEGEEKAQTEVPAKPPAKGHGRLGAVAYTGAERIEVPHESLHNGDPCPHCKGRLYTQKEPAVLIRIRACPPLEATRYEQERLRCNLCGEVFTAKPAEGVGDEKFDPSVASLTAVLRYGSGLPFNRIAKLEESFGLPFPASTQWDLVEEAATKLDPVYRAIVELAAQGPLVHNDDTPMKILDHLWERHQRRERGEPPRKRNGTFTTGLVSIGKEHTIALYFTGHRHAGENLAEVLKQRASGLRPPLQMCDGLERNLPGELETIVGNCMTHARRAFVDVAESFPAEVRHVLEELKLVYKTDAKARTERLSPEDRLALHRRESQPVMNRLEAWLRTQVAEKRVEPNSGLGQAIEYARKRWGRLTLFLREPGAPLDNNVCERMLKRAILHRKNSLFYKTENGARVGDLYMSLIATANLARANPFDYLTQLQRHAKEVAAHPAAWLPWNYRETLTGPPG